MSTFPTRTRRRPLGVQWRRFAAPTAVIGGGLLGSVARASITELFPTSAGRFPLTTFLVNLAGSLLLGFFLARRQRAVTHRWELHFWAIGALGSFTTFSTFTVEVARLMDAAAWGIVAGYGVGSIVLGLSAALLGQRLGRLGR